MQPFLSLDTVTVSYGAFTALHDLTLNINPGEFFCLLGPSGSGKSTALGVIAGFTDVTRGTVTLDGADITHLAPQKRRMGVVFQSYALFPHMTAEQNIGYALKVRGEPKDRIAMRAAELLALVRLEGKADRFPRQMSGGEQQRVAIARSLAIEPQLMLLDEPLSNLDARLREEMRDEIRRIQRETGVTTILVTHDQEEAFGIGDRIAILNKGRLEQIGTPSEIYWSPETPFVAHFIGQANVIDGLWDAASNTFRVGAQSFRCTRAAAPNGPASLFLRPEEIMVGGTAQTNSLPGVIESVAALGSTLHIRVSTAAGRLLIYRLSEIDQPLKPGDTVQVSWAEGAGRIMRKDQT